MTRAVPAALLLVVSAWPRPAAAAPAERAALATLGNGVNVAFALLRTGTPQGASEIGEAVYPRSNRVSRVLADEAGATYFGYRLEIEPAGRGHFHVSVLPLDETIEAELRAARPCPGCPPPQLLAPLLRYPPPRIVADGDVFVLELLFNPTTREKIVDLVKVAEAAIAADALADAAALYAEALDAVRAAEDHLRGGRHADALAALQRAARIYPNDAVILNKLGNCYQTVRRPGDAERAYEEALRLNPAYAEAWNNLGTVQHARGNYRLAVKSYQKAQALKPDLASAYSNMGAAYVALGAYDPGFRAFQNAYRLDPGSLRAPAAVPVSTSSEGAAMQAFYFAKIYAAAGRLDAALEQLEKAVAAGFHDFAAVTSDPVFDALGTDPRYRTLVARHSPSPPKR